MCNINHLLNLFKHLEPRVLSFTEHWTLARMTRFAPLYRPMIPCNENEVEQAAEQNCHEFLYQMWLYPDRCRQHEEWLRGITRGFKNIANPHLGPMTSTQLSAICTHQHTIIPICHVTKVKLLLSSSPTNPLRRYYAAVWPTFDKLLPHGVTDLRRLLTLLMARWSTINLWNHVMSVAIDQWKLCIGARLSRLTCHGNGKYNQ